MGSMHLVYHRVRLGLKYFRDTETQDSEVPKIVSISVRSLCGEQILINPSHPRTDADEILAKNVWLKGHTGE